LDLGDDQSRYLFILYRYEDHRSLDGGDDGMNVVKQILQGSRFLIKDGG